MTISQNQKKRFVRDGYLPLYNAINEGVIEEIMIEINDAVNIEFDETEEIRGRGYERVKNIEKMEPFAELRNQLFDYATELAGDCLQQPCNDSLIPDRPQIKIKYPEQIRLSDVHRRRPVDGHLDGYGPGFRNPSSDTAGEYSYPMIGAIAYLNEVKPNGGGFTVYPGAHWVAEDYYQDHSIESPGHEGTLPAIDDGGGWDYEGYFQDQVKSKEITGEAGTVVLWHMKLLHGVGINQRNSPRIAAIDRYNHTLSDQIKRDAARNIWKYWDGLEGIAKSREKYNIIN